MLQEIEYNVRKKNASFIEKLFQEAGYDIYHSRYKDIVYGDCCAETKIERKYKRFYDCYVYMLANQRNEITVSFIRKVYYLLFEKELEIDEAIRIQSKFYYPSKEVPLQKIIDFHFFLYQCFPTIQELDRKLLSFLFLNYLLYKYDFSPIVFLYQDLKEYQEIKNKYEMGKKTDAFFYFSQLLKKQKEQAKPYYANLIPLDLNKIYDTIKSSKEDIQTLFQIQSVSIFGSFSQNKGRIDSDIDVWIIFEEEMTYENKLEKKKEFEKYLKNKLNRYIDSMEFNRFIQEDMVHILKNAIQVF